MTKTKAPSQTGIVLALGGGGAAGLAHVGVLQVLAENGIPVRAIAGTSIGAQIGGFIASGMPVNDLAALSTAIDWKQTLQLFMPDLPTGGLISGVKIVDFLKSWLGAQRIEELGTGYVAVTADLVNGEQVVLDTGSLVDAVRASISVPGVIAPLRHGERWLVDGGVVNPVPFDVARSRFGGPVLAVAVHSGARSPAPRQAELPVPPPQWPAHVRQLLGQPWMARAPGLRAWLETQVENAHRRASRTKPYWVARRVLDRVLDIAENEIMRLRAAASPPDLLLVPDVGDIGLMEFYRAREAIAAGRRAAEAQLAAIRALSGASR
jgi:NTE family protein